MKLNEMKFSAPNKFSATQKFQSKGQKKEKNWTGLPKHLVLHFIKLKKK